MPLKPLVVHQRRRCICAVLHGLPITPPHIGMASTLISAIASLHRYHMHFAMKVLFLRELCRIYHIARIHNPQYILMPYRITICGPRHD